MNAQVVSLEVLSVHVVLAFLLNSLVHRPDDHSRFRPVAKLLWKHVNQGSSVLFCASLLGLQTSGAVALREPLSSEALKAHFPASLINMAIDSAA